MVIDWYNPLVFYPLLVAVFLVIRKPKIREYLHSINTLIHEAAHAIAALILSGKLVSIKIFSNTEGETLVRSSNRLGTLFIAIVGYPAAALCGFLLLYALRIGQAYMAILILTVLSIVFVLLFIRNWYGFFWLLSFLTINLLAIWYNKIELLNYLCLIFSFVIIAEALYSPLVLFRISLKNPKAAGDASVLKSITYLPAFFWSIVFIILNYLIIFFTVSNLFPPIFAIK